MVSERQRISHVVRRLGYGANASVAEASADTDDAIGRALDLTSPVDPPPAYDPPLERDDVNDYRAAVPSVLWWIEQMGSGRRLIEERMIWFWHDHFAMHVRKIGVPYLAIQHHHLLREHATGNFAELLHAVAVDPAMLRYLDTVQSSAESPNENFAREVMELHTLGSGNYTEQDIVELARAMTGWIVASPLRRTVGYAPVDDAAPWSSVFVPFRWDPGMKTVLGTTAAFDMQSAIDLLLDQPHTARFVSAKLYRELVGLKPDTATVEALATAFRADYQIMPLVEAIATSAGFTSEASVNAKVRSPLEKLAGLIDAFDTDLQRSAVPLLEQVGYLPFTAPNPSGYATGMSLLGPYQFVHVFDLATAVIDPPLLSPDETFARLGVFDVSQTSLDVIAGTDHPISRLALAIASPEHALV